MNSCLGHEYLLNKLILEFDVSEVVYIVTENLMLLISGMSVMNVTERFHIIFSYGVLVGEVF